MCAEHKIVKQEKSTYQTLKLFVLFTAWLEQEEDHSQRPIIVREWYID